MLFKRKARSIDVSPDEVEAIRSGSLEPCRWCGGYHNHACPYIAEIYFEGPTPTRVRFHDAFYIDMAPNVVWDSDLPPAPTVSEPGQDG